ncbi:hypothetical protein MJ021_17920 [Acinetobacter baumannii]|uniref:hypothetical protein n=1 Tax=Acinetobacter calcoaceticus/baumannii complex TaxID=909768 RepID=UPI00124FD443|nr:MULTISPECIES: hypothetical protein [Acinetobacter calcoaceticus/baumannii complex]EHU3335376.1 hypothetical protein [Acinetobacter baumannii]MDA3487165.1 hypothetical protein [Acinetobacter baumannii]MDV4232018.1 hypothetical protein [Acinetobacter baumannii]MDV4274629.1 hypothetical protein [Acinetobacter baumannii]
MLCPLQEGYGFTPGNDIREQQNEGGMPRQAPFFVGSPHSVTVSVLLKDDEDRQYFWAFWRTKQRKPENWLWELSLDHGIVEECECRFTSSSLPGESKRNGVVVMVSFQVLVKPIKRSAEFDQNIVNLRQGVESGETSEIVDDIEKVPNEWLADALGAKK